jgi:hypothetical protein
MDKQQFVQLYVSLGFATEADPWPGLRQSCENATQCWHGVEGEDESVISQPWIGARYDDLRLLAIGINFNGGGQSDLATSYVQGARNEIGRGNKLVFGNEKYRGTSFYYKLGLYAALFAKKAGLLTYEVDAHGHPNAHSVSAGFDYIGFVNHIKCSPKPNDGKPTPTMWRRCGKHVLLHEIEIFAPHTILILGIDNFWGFARDVVPISVPSFKMDESNRTHVIHASAVISGKEVTVYGVRHPRAGSAYAHLKAVLDS